MTTDELRAKFEVLPCPFCGGIPVDHLKIHGRCIECQGCGASGPETPFGGDARDMMRLWNHRAHASRDAEVEALRKDAERYRWLRNSDRIPDGDYLDTHLVVTDASGEDVLWNNSLDVTIDAAMQAE